MKCTIYARSATHEPDSVAKQIQACRQKAQEGGLESPKDLVFKEQPLSRSNVSGVSSYNRRACNCGGCGSPLCCHFSGASQSREKEVIESTYSPTTEDISDTGADQ